MSQLTTPASYRLDLDAILDHVNMTANFSISGLSPKNSEEGRLSSSSVMARLVTLCIFWMFIVFGNILVICVARQNYRKQVPDLLILSLAMIDLINGLTTVSISIGLYLFTENGFNDIHKPELCIFYNSIASATRLASCFIATIMAVERAISISKPLYYRTKVGKKKVRKAILFLVFLACLIASVPIFGRPRVFAYDVVCSFDFGSPYAAFVMLLGYTQLLIVASSYILVIKGLVGFIERQASFRRHQQRPSMLDEAELMKYLAKGRRKSSSAEIMRDVGIFKTSKQFARIMGTVVFLFYLSWLPIVLSITLRLASGKYSQTMQLLSARMSLIGSTANPLVYGIMSRTYRTGYFQVIKHAISTCRCLRLPSFSKGPTMGLPIRAVNCNNPRSTSNQLIVHGITPAVIVTDVGANMDPDEELNMSSKENGEQAVGHAQMPITANDISSSKSLPKLENDSSTDLTIIGKEIRGLVLEQPNLKEAVDDKSKNLSFVSQKTQAEARPHIQTTTCTDSGAMACNSVDKTTFASNRGISRQLRKQDRCKEYRHRRESRFKARESFFKKFQRQHALNFHTLTERSCSEEEEKGDAGNLRNKLHVLRTKSSPLARAIRQRRIPKLPSVRFSQQSYDDIAMRIVREDSTML